jgi:uncharacterized membrane-anchored protein
MKINRFLLSGVIVAVLQSGTLYAMVEKHAMVLRHGTSIMLETEPVDPRDLLRGEYVRLGYGISSVAADKVAGEKPETAGLVDIYVVVKEGTAGRWDFSSASWQKRTDIAAGEVQIHGRTLSYPNAVTTGVYRVQYGIERFYLPEGWGRAIEDVQKERKIDAVIAVAQSGEAQIRSLRDNGHLLYQEPAY